MITVHFLHIDIMLNLYVLLPMLLWGPRATGGSRWLRRSAAPRALPTPSSGLRSQLERPSKTVDRGARGEDVD